MLDSRKWQLYATDPAAFRDDLVIDRGGTPCRLGDCMDPWQRADFEALDGAWLKAVGRDPGARLVVPRAWLERPRGHSKSSDIAVMVVWALVFAPRVVRGFAGAGDRDQARLIRDAIHTLVQLNPMLRPILDVQAWRVVNVAQGHPGNGSELQILSSDVATSFGLLGDFFVCDEPSHWSDAGEGLWTSLLSAAAKRPNALLVAILNAGWRSHWSWRVREAVRESAGWYFSHLDGSCASWITPEALAEQQKLLPSIQYSRLWGNLWSDESGEGLNPYKLGLCVCRTGPMDFKPPSLPIVSTLIDVGWKRDNCGIVAIGMDFQRQKLVLVDRVRLSPKQYASGQIQLSDVKRVVYDFRKRFGATNIIADTWQCVGLLQELGTEGFWCLFREPNAPRVNENAKALIEAVDEGILELFPSGLVEDLKACTIVERPHGLKVEFPRDERGHGDEGSALVGALPILLQDMRLAANEMGMARPKRGAWDENGLRGPLVNRLEGRTFLSTD
jgi:hypothetical protein